MIRRGTLADLPFVAEIQAASPEASHWAAEDYLGYELLVEEQQGAIRGFLVWRQVAPDEREILNLAVAPEARCRGIGAELVRSVLEPETTVFLEVRESNLVARKFYAALGFRDAGCRRNYYQNPREHAVVMKLQS